MPETQQNDKPSWYWKKNKNKNTQKKKQTDVCTSMYGSKQQTNHFPKIKKTIFSMGFKPINRFSETAS